MIDATTINFIAVFAGVVIGIILTQLTADVTPIVHKIVVSVMAVLAVMGSLATGGQVLVPALFSSLIVGYVAGVTFETNGVMLKLRAQAGK
jgi:4-hydroxybenzoate polyprenyltransferase